MIVVTLVQDRSHAVILSGPIVIMTGEGGGGGGGYSLHHNR